MAIIKKSRATKVKSKPAHVRDLIDYVCDAVEPAPRPRPVPAREPRSEPSSPRPKVLYLNADGFISRTRRGWKVEMLALATLAPRSKNPFLHWIISWKRGEVPTPAQFDQATEMLLDELGLTGHQVVYAAHQDTENIHLHIVTNRVHPSTAKVIKPNGGFDIEAAHRAIARIEHVQGWSPEPNARYRVDPDGQVRRTSAPVPPKPRGPSQRALQIETWTGERSSERIAIEDVAPIIASAQSWPELHKKLGAVGVRYEKKGSGALLLIGDVAVKASSAGRACSLPALAKRIGSFEPADTASVPTPRPPEPIDDLPGRREFVEARRAHYAAKGDEERALRARHAADLLNLREKQKVERSDVYGARSWKGRGAARSALVKATAVTQTEVQAALKARHVTERAGLRDRFRPWPDFDTWMLHRSPRLGPVAVGVMVSFADVAAKRVVARDLGGFSPRVSSERVDYLDASGHVAFADVGDQVLMYACDRDSVLAALRLAEAKWGALVIEGNHAFLDLCIDLAGEHGFEIRNPELQDRIAVARERWQLLQEPAPTGAAPQDADDATRVDAMYDQIWRLWLALDRDQAGPRQRASWDTISRLDAMLQSARGATSLTSVLDSLPLHELSVMCAEVASRHPEVLEMERADAAKFLAMLDSLLPLDHDERHNWRALQLADQRGIPLDDSDEALAWLAADPEAAETIRVEFDTRRGELEELEQEFSARYSGPAQ